MTVAPRHRAVVVLFKAHHDARAKGLLEVVNFTRLQIPAYFAFGIQHEVVWAVVPLDRAACGVVPHDFGALAGFIYEVIYVVETVGEFSARSLYDFDFIKQRALLRRHAGALQINRRSVNFIGFFYALGLPLVNFIVLDLDGVLIVRVKSKNRDSAVRAQMLVSDFIADNLTAGLWYDSDFRVC